MRPALNNWWNYIPAEIRAIARPSANLNNNARFTDGIVTWLASSNMHTENVETDRTAPTGGTATAANSLFILSLSEANHWIGNEPGSANTRVATCNNGTTPRYWWLRSPGNDSSGPVAIVNPGGTYAACFMSSAIHGHFALGIRPALWIMP